MIKERSLEKIRRDSKRIMQLITKVALAILEGFSIRKIYQLFFSRLSLAQQAFIEEKKYAHDVM